MTSDWVPGVARRATPVVGGTLREPQAPKQAKSAPMTSELPRTGRLAAIDYGTVRLGVAITDPDQRLASPLENYTRCGNDADAAWLIALANRERIAGFIV